MQSPALRRTMTSALLFDLDGTLTDPREGITRCVRHALESVGAPVPNEEELARWIGPPLQDSLRAHLERQTVRNSLNVAENGSARSDRVGGVSSEFISEEGGGACRPHKPRLERRAVKLVGVLGPSGEGLVARALSEYRARFATTGMFENAVYPNIPEALEDLQRQGLPLFVATSKPTPFAERIVEHFGLSRYFAGVYGSELSGERSDKGELIAHVLRAENLAPSRVSMVGDRAHDIVGARRNGVRALGVLWGYGDAAELVEAGADAIFATVRDLSLALRELHSQS
ncbi:MAG TPA: HAD hydrolase-like protein [Polyangiaceae bacterium]|nr:HAD hydrolase-like protein [Polyangiaceae bacterium]